MGDQRGGGIAWTDETWNPLRGCSRVSEGCRHCYAEVVAARFSGPGQPYEGLAKKAPPRWTGQVRLVEAHLDDPLRWARPRRVFVNSMSDLFHESLPPADLGRVLNVMSHAKRHTFQVLTKRPLHMRRAMRAWRETFHEAPMPHVWLGVSVENQATANERIPLLLDTPAAVRWVSYEPALGPVDFTRWLPVPTIGGVEMERWLDWIVVGGESGPGARPFDLAWARTTVAQGRAAGVPVFVKQLGAKPFEREVYANGDGTGTRAMFDLRDRKGADLAEWPEDLRVREFPR